MPQDGYYDAVCTGNVSYGSGEKGPQVAIELEIGNERGTCILSFSDKARQYSDAKLKACGFDGTGDIGAAIKGHRVRVGVITEEYNGRFQQKWNIFDGSSTFKFKREMTESERAQFMKSLSGSAPAVVTAKVTGYPSEWDKPRSR